MINATTYNNVIKTLRNQLIKQGELRAQNVVNAESVRGPDLIKILDGINVVSANVKDIFVIFDIVKDNFTDDDVILYENDNTISAYSSLKMTLKIYGSMSNMCANMIRARFKTEAVAALLRDNGIYMKGISSPEDAKEFINNTLWPRWDMEIEFKIRYNFKNLAEVEYFDDNINNIKLQVKNIL